MAERLDVPDWVCPGCGSSGGMAMDAAAKHWWCCKCGHEWATRQERDRHYLGRKIKVWAIEYLPYAVLFGLYLLAAWLLVTVWTLLLEIREVVR